MQELHESAVSAAIVLPHSNRINDPSTSTSSHPQNTPGWCTRMNKFDIIAAPTPTLYYSSLTSSEDKW
ncbi:unnamed protein product [Phytophthora fragariaefolia]|uniref:Unnamed protein product n=1 Tax=Phytophthora fragariaefolia TaxID=1490495 RepID=A0A9W6Y4Q6_9STRA|nr:unnamed protein product [Phytophthora fragariaefolia]